MPDAVWAAIIGGLIGFISTYVVAVVKVRQDLRAEYDKDLRERRIPEYSKL
jgi:heme exporter protein D